LPGASGPLVIPSDEGAETGTATRTGAATGTATGVGAATGGGAWNGVVVHGRIAYKNTDK
jgi:RES domain-containing protein